MKSNSQHSSNLLEQPITGGDCLNTDNDGLALARLSKLGPSWIDWLYIHWKDWLDTLLRWRGFAFLNNPRRSVVSGFMPLVGPSMANRSWGGKIQSITQKTPLMKNRMIPNLAFPDTGYWGPFLEPSLGTGHDSGRLVAWTLAMGSGRAQPEVMCDPFPISSCCMLSKLRWASRQHSSPPAEGAKGVRYIVCWVARARDNGGLTSRSWL